MDKNLITVYNSADLDHLDTFTYQGNTTMYLY